MRVYKIVSGGQTGVDIAALDVALELGIETGGWVPKARLNEAGVIPAYYPGLIETASTDPAIRTEYNVRDSDITLILARGILRGGTLYTENMARHYGRPCLCVDLNETAMESPAIITKRWPEAFEEPVVLNVAGPRESESPGVYRLARQFLSAVIALSL